MKQLEKARKIFLERRGRSAQNLLGKATEIVRENGSVAGLTANGTPIENGPITSRNQLGSGFRLILRHSFSYPPTSKGQAACVYYADLYNLSDFVFWDDRNDLFDISDVHRSIE